MTLLSLISVFSAALALVMGAVVLLQNRRDALHQIFCLLSFMISFAAFTEFGFRQAESAEVARFWLRLSQGSLLIIPTIVYFILLFTEKITTTTRYPIVALLFLPALLLGGIDILTNQLSGNPVQMSWGWGQFIEHSTWFHVYSAWSTALLAIASIISVWYFLKTVRGRKRSQAKYISIATTLIFLITVGIDTGMNYINLQLPEFATFGYACANLLIAYSIWRHKLFVLNPGTAADAILETMSDALFLIAPEGTIAYANSAAKKLFGTNDDTLKEHRLEDLISSDTPLLKRTNSGVFCITNQIHDTSAVTMVTSEGHALPLSIAGKTIREDDAVLGTIITARDISDRVRTEVALKESYELLEERVRQRTEELHCANRALADERELLSVTLRSIGDGVISTDLDGTIVFINNAAEKITGWRADEAIGLPVTSILQIIATDNQQIEPDPIRKAIQSGNQFDMTAPVQLKTRDESLITVDDSAAPIKNATGKTVGGVIVFRDITEKERLEEELLRGKRLESVALLAGGIAHDFNNLLTGINNNLFLCKLSAPDNNNLIDIVDDTEREILRAQQLATKLLTFAQGGEPVLEVCSPRRVIEESIGFFMSGSNCTYTLDFDEGLMNFKTDRGMVEQVLHNLILNAEQAMPDGGTVFISATNTIIDTKYFDSERRLSVPLSPGIYVRITIRDVGAGIPEHVREKIFDPFFSTKGKGRGLGLSIAQSVLKKHGGHITVESDVKAGTTFYLYFPAVEESAPEQVAFDGLRYPMSHQVSGEKILLMDDDTSICRTTSKILATMGYNVVTVSNGEEAIDCYREAIQSSYPFDLVLLDITIPGGMGGKECLLQLKKINSRVAAIVSSGYSTDAVIANYRKHGFKGVLKKPYSVENLVRVIREVLEETIRS